MQELRPAPQSGYVQAYNNQGSKYCGQKWQSLARGRRDCCWDSCFAPTGSTTSFWNGRRRAMGSAASGQGFWGGERELCPVEGGPAGGGTPGGRGIPGSELPSRGAGPP